MFVLIASLLVTLTAVSAAPAQVPFVPNVQACLTCQVVAEGVTAAFAGRPTGAQSPAVATGIKMGYYNQLTAGDCTALFPAGTVRNFCNDVVDTGRNALSKLLIENKWDYVDTCIALGACEPKSCESKPSADAALTGLERLANTQLCYSCTTAPVDRFAVEYFEEDLQATFPGVHLCSVDEYRLLSGGGKLVSQKYFTSDYFSNCATPNDVCTANVDIDKSNGNTPVAQPFVWFYRGDTWIVDHSAPGTPVSKGADVIDFACFCARYGDNVPRYFE